ncbi:partial nonribosomal peptide synthetase DhbF, partial [Anaerolineales bacterium]
MTTVDLLSRLRDLDIRLWIADEQLCYNAPDGVLTTDLLAELTERKEEILAFLRRAKHITGSISSLKRSGTLETELPLSFAQERLWFLSQLAPNSSDYNIPEAIQLTGPLNVAALEQAFNEIVRRHESLRTTFATVSGHPRQVIAPALTISLPVIDLHALPDTVRKAELHRVSTAEAQRSFDLTHGPLLRIALLRLNEEEHILLLTVHHIIFDGWSMGIFNQEMTILYQAFMVGQRSPLPKLPIQYTDFAAWQREWLQKEERQELLSYWKQQLLNAPAMLRLPTDRPRPPIQNLAGASQPLSLSQELTARLEKLSQQEGTTLFMTLLAAFAVILYRHTGQEDIVVGSPIANRNSSEIEGLIGFFVNMLALRVNLSGNPIFRMLLQRTRKMILEAYAYQDLPFEVLVQHLQPERDLSYMPLVQVVFALHNVPLKDVPEMAGLNVKSLEVDTWTARFDLSVALVKTEQGLVGTLEYSTDLFEPATIARLAEHFQTLLAGIVADPDQPIEQLPLLSQAERQQLL